jgi:hypothetical protein
MVQAPAPGRGAGTRLYFGSAVVPLRDAKTGGTRMGPLFRALLGFHRLYSRVLLRAAAKRLSRSGAGEAPMHERDVR